MLGTRQHYPKIQALPRLAGNGKRATVPFDHCFHEGQPQPHAPVALVFAAAHLEEGLEQMRQIRLCNTHTLIDDVQDQTVFIFICQAHGDGGMGWRILERIVDHIDQRADQHVRIAHDQSVFQRALRADQFNRLALRSGHSWSTASVAMSSNTNGVKLSRRICSARES